MQLHKGYTLGNDFSAKAEKTSRSKPNKNSTEQHE